MYGKNIFFLSGTKKSLKFGLLNQNTPLKILLFKFKFYKKSHIAELKSFLTLKCFFNSKAT